MVSNFLCTLREPDSCVFGTWVKLRSPETLESLAQAGFDFVVIDMEHAPHTFESAYRCIVLAQGLGLKVLVRLPDSESGYVQRILDSGVDGLLIPRVRSADESRRVMEGMLFSPQGSRGLGITSRAGQWGLMPKSQYVQEGNELVLRVPQLEDPSALSDVEAILDVEGVNGIFIGAGDLALSTGKPATHPDNVQLVNHVLEVAKSRRVPCGTAVGDAAAAQKARDKGFNFVLVSNDLTMFAKTAFEIMRNVRG